MAQSESNAPSSGPDEKSGEKVEEKISDAVGTVEEAVMAILDWINDEPEKALLVGGIFISVFVVLRLARSLILSSLGRFKTEQGTGWAGVLYRTAEATNSLFLFAAALYLALTFGGGPAPARRIADFLLMFFGIFQAAFWIRALIIGLVERRVAQSDDPRSTFSNAFQIITLLLNAAIFSIAFLVLFDNVGFDITALVAGLGIGGIAIGLAAQGVFQDLFSSLSILFDKPFQKGDFVIFGDKMGTVEQIGMKTTRIRSLWGEQLVIGNTNLLNKEIHNYQRMRRRRIQFRFGLVYQTTAEKLREAKSIVTEIIEDQDKVTLDRVHFFDFGDSSLDFEVIYFVESPDYLVYMDINERIRLAMAERFADAGLDFAYPTRTLFLAQPDASPVDIGTEVEAAR